MRNFGAGCVVMCLRRIPVRSSSLILIDQTSDGSTLGSQRSEFALLRCNVASGADLRSTRALTLNQIEPQNCCDPSV